MTETIHRLKEVKARTGLSRSSIYALIKKGHFPSPIPLGARSVGFLDSEINDWIQARVSARTASLQKEVRDVQV